MISKREIVLFILIGTLLELFKWLPIQDNDLFTAIYDLVNISTYSFIFVLLFSFRFKHKIIYLALFNKLLESAFIFNDVLYIDKYDSFFEIIHLSVLFLIIYNCILYLTKKEQQR